MAIHIWWIRRDLRLHDNQALAAALSGATALVPLFVLDPRLTESTVRSPRRLSFLFACLRALDGELRRRGSRLIVRVGDPVTVVSEVAREAGARLVVAEADATPYARQRDAAVSTRVPLTLKPGLTIHPPGTVHRPDGRPYTVFTQFARAWHARGVPDRRELLSAPPVLPPPPALATVPLPEPTETIPDRFPIGEAAARRQLQRFLEERLLTYDTGRNLLDGSGSSQLSPYFRFGLLSVREAWVRAAAVAQEPSGTRGVQAWLNELVWREFYHHLLAAFPTSVRCSLRPAFDRAPWVRDEALFRRWRDGETGFPVVDAAMRQLA
ncbi:MAG: deoxyribodipyrimidine photo-lyase, partial [Thermomicrobium sp.]|nr:deoxyribodipyrimidine photo-lyase [Thermomicrobium sp.]